jgi:PD-(D/E)XK nuclease superfamily
LVTEASVNVLSMLRVTDILTGAGLIDKSKYAPGGDVRGTLAHEATVLVDDDTFGDCDDRVRPYVEAYRAYRAELSPAWEWALTERRLADAGLHYSGQIDRLGVRAVGGGVLLRVVDFKTGGPEAWHPIQLAAYERLARIWAEQATSLYARIVGIERTVVHLRNDGTFRQKAYDDPHDWSVFLACLTLYRFKRRTTHARSPQADRNDAGQDEGGSAPSRGRRRAPAHGRRGDVR